MNLRKWWRTLHEARLKAQRDQWAMEEAMKEDSMAAGMAEGMAQGMAEGMAVGLSQGELLRSRQAILDLLEDFGEIPQDIRGVIDSEEDRDILKIWLKSAARAEDFEDFRNRIK